MSHEESASDGEIFIVHHLPWLSDEVNEVKKLLDNTRSGNPSKKRINGPESERRPKKVSRELMKEN